jgi:biotin--protein ligase
LKWPNDIYADMGEGEGMSRYKKIGGILVNSSFANGEFTIVTGTSDSLLHLNGHGVLMPI